MQSFTQYCQKKYNPLRPILPEIPSFVKGFVKGNYIFNIPYFTLEPGKSIETIMNYLPAGLGNYLLHSLTLSLG